ncbi:MAG: HAMP domain-containing protein, partial [Kiritimatiellia bacterium]
MAKMRSSLFVRLLASQLAVVIIALLAVGFSLSYLYTGYIFDLKEQELTRIGTQLSRELRDPSPGSLNRLGALLNAAVIYGDTSVWIADETGLIVLPQEVAGLSLGEAEAKRISNGETIAWRTVWKEQNESVFSVAVPVITSEGAGGAVILNSPMRGIMKTVNGARRYIFLSAILAIGLAAFVSFLFARRVAGPLQEMRSVATDMANGDFARRVEVKGDDEVAELALALNDMAGRLGSTIQALGEEKAKTESVVAGLAEGVLALDKEGRVHLINNAAQLLLSPLYLEVGQPLAATESVHVCGDRLVATFAK